MKHVLAFVLACSVPAFADSEALKGAKKDVQSFKREMRVRLDHIDAKIEKLKGRGNAQKKETIQDLEHARDRVRAKIDDVSVASQNRWSKIKRRVSESVDSLNRRVQKVLKE